MLVGYLVNFESHTNVGSRETSLFIFAAEEDENHEALAVRHFHGSLNVLGPLTGKTSPSGSSKNLFGWDS